MVVCDRGKVIIAWMWSGGMCVCNDGLGGGMCGCDDCLNVTGTCWEYF